jgi:hypothetical protein
MPMSINIQSDRARNGFAYPLDAREVRALLRSAVDVAKEQIDVRCKNPRSSAEEQEIVEAGLNWVTLFSLPAALSGDERIRDRVRSALRRAACIITDKRRKWIEGGSYVFCLDASFKHWKLIRRVVKEFGATYRGTEKFSNAFKPRSVRRTERVLEIE